MKQDLQAYAKREETFDDNVSDISIYFKNNYWQSISTFIVVLIAVGLKYGLITGSVASISATLVVIFVGFFVSKRKRAD